MNAGSLFLLFLLFGSDHTPCSGGTAIAYRGQNYLSFQTAHYRIYLWNQLRNPGPCTDSSWLSFAFESGVLTGKDLLAPLIKHGAADSENYSDLKPWFPPTANADSLYLHKSRYPDDMLYFNGSCNGRTFEIYELSHMKIGPGPEYDTLSFTITVDIGEPGTGTSQSGLACYRVSIALNRQMRPDPCPDIRRISHLVRCTHLGWII